MRHYADSSFLVSCYLADVNTAAAQAWLTGHSSRLPFTSLHALEVQNAFQLAVFRRMISTEDAARAMGLLRSDLRARRLVPTAIDWPAVWRVARRLSRSHSAAIGSRSLDILHVAAARSLGCLELVSFDTRQRSLATAIGLHSSP